MINGAGESQIFLFKKFFDTAFGRVGASFWCQIIKWGLYTKNFFPLPPEKSLTKLFFMRG